ncbi:hypothetical protein ATI45_2490 [Marinobacter sp. LV10MA510-1]|nr:hypothetical protein ATI45_2490 [Marinobacter sp. LV10MA510-1]
MTSVALATDSCARRGRSGQIMAMLVSTVHCTNNDSKPKYPQSIQPFCVCAIASASTSTSSSLVTSNMNKARTRHRSGTKNRASRAVALLPGVCFNRVRMLYSHYFLFIHFGPVTSGCQQEL